MQSTMELLDKAAQVKRLADWNRELKLNENALFVAKNRGRLSPVIAGVLAHKLGENVKEWMAIAVLETEKDSNALDYLKKTIDDWRKR